MSYLAIYDVTHALQKLLYKELVDAGGSGVVVTLLPPGNALADTMGVNLYLYRTVESPSTRNRAWPGDRSTPASDRPALGLQLYYLLTPLGAKPTETGPTGDDSHQMLGRAMLALQEHPVLNDVHTPDFDADIELPAYLLDSYETIKISLVPASLDELSKIWSTINQPYRLSVVYEVSLVELAPTTPPPSAAGVVSLTNLAVQPMGAPQLVGLQPDSGALARYGGGALSAQTMSINGFGLQFPGVPATVKVGGRPAAVQSAPPPTDTSLTVALPIELDAGPQADVTVAIDGRASVPFSFQVEPWLSRTRPQRTALDPAVPADLKLVMDGTGLGTAQRAHFDGPTGSGASMAFDPGGTDFHAVVQIPVSLANGVYQVRLEISGGAATNARSLEVMPMVGAPQIAVIPPTGNPPNQPVHQVTLVGERLAGSDIRLRIDDATYLAGPNANAQGISLTLGRLLPPGPHNVAVVVDGHASRSVAFSV